MPFIKIWVHFVWSTENREKIINRELQPKLLSHIKNNAKNKKIFIDTINCMSDHIHLLISIGTDQKISELVKLIKGESSFWINHEKLIKTKFNWQNDYYGVSVSESVVEKVREYIRNQQEHHRIKSFEEEVNEFHKKYGFKVIEK